ncbi:hypothetical protein ABW19_dt0200518 [Dactylella cylindrospora]|nr:hypothetical protein ABW19_dt0200518 [Dactylella cylindrospora]
MSSSKAQFHPYSRNTKSEKSKGDNPSTSNSSDNGTKHNADSIPSFVSPTGVAIVGIPASAVFDEQSFTSALENELFSAFKSISGSQGQQAGHEPKSQEVDKGKDDLTIENIIKEAETHGVSQIPSSSLQIVEKVPMESGGATEVYRYILNGREVAVRQLLPLQSYAKGKMKEQFPSEGPATFVEPVRNRIKAALEEIKLQGHPAIKEDGNIVKLLGICVEGVDPGIPLQQLPFDPTAGNIRLVLITESADADAPTLAEWIRRNIVPPEDVAIKAAMLYDVAKGLSALHRAGTIHGNLNPENIFVFSAGEERPIAKIGYPGYSHTSEESSRPGGGMDYWTAPEDIPGGYFDKSPVRQPSRDIYSFGLVAFSLLLGRRLEQHRPWESHKDRIQRLQEDIRESYKLNWIDFGENAADSPNFIEKGTFHTKYENLDSMSGSQRDDTIRLMDRALKEGLVQWSIHNISRFGDGLGDDGGETANATSTVENANGPKGISLADILQGLNLERDGNTIKIGIGCKSPPSALDLSENPLGPIKNALEKAVLCAAALSMAKSSLSGGDAISFFESLMDMDQGVRPDPAEPMREPAKQNGIKCIRIGSETVHYDANTLRQIVDTPLAIPSTSNEHRRSVFERSKADIRREVITALSDALPNTLVRTPRKIRNSFQLRDYTLAESVASDFEGARPSVSPEDIGRLVLFAAEECGCHESPPYDILETMIGSIIQEHQVRSSILKAALGSPIVNHHSPILNLFLRDLSHMTQSGQYLVRAPDISAILHPKAIRQSIIWGTTEGSILQLLCSNLETCTSGPMGTDDKAGLRKHFREELEPDPLGPLEITEAHHGPVVVKFPALHLCALTGNNEGFDLVNHVLRAEDRDVLASGLLNPLHLAAISRNAPLIDRILDGSNQVNLNIRVKGDGMGFTPFHLLSNPPPLAVKVGSTWYMPPEPMIYFDGSIESLINNPRLYCILSLLKQLGHGNAPYQDLYGLSPFAFYLRNGDLSAASLIFAFGDCFNMSSQYAVDFCENTLVHQAILSQDVETVRFVLNNCNRTDGRVNAIGMTPAALAASLGSMDILKEILDGMATGSLGQYLKRKDKFGCSIVQLTAVAGGAEKAMEMLSLLFMLQDSKAISDSHVKDLIRTKDKADKNIFHYLFSVPIPEEEEDSTERALTFVEMVLGILGEEDGMALLKGEDNVGLNPLQTAAIHGNIHLVVLLEDKYNSSLPESAFDYKKSSSFLDNLSPSDILMALIYQRQIRVFAHLYGTAGFLPYANLQRPKEIGLREYLTALITGWRSGEDAGYKNIMKEVQQGECIARQKAPGFEGEKGSFYGFGPNYRTGRTRYLPQGSPEKLRWESRLERCCNEYARNQMRQVSISEFADEVEQRLLDDSRPLNGERGNKRIRLEVEEDMELEEY